MPGFSVGLGLLSRPKISSTHPHGTMNPRWPLIPMAEFSLHDGASRRSGGRSLGITRFRTSPWNERITDCYSERMESRSRSRPPPPPRSPPPPVRQAAAHIASPGTRKARKSTSSQKSEKKEKNLSKTILFQTKDQDLSKESRKDTVGIDLSSVRWGGVFAA